MTYYSFLLIFDTAEYRNYSTIDKIINSMIVVELVSFHVWAISTKE